MAIRYRQLYNMAGVYAGPAPADTYHYADYNLSGHNNPSLSIFDNNLLKQIDRVNNFKYGVDIERVNLTQLGKRGLINRHIVNAPIVRIDFNYWIAGVRNEDRLGLVVNYPDATGAPIYNEEICCFKNFTGQSTDFRNLFVAISPDSEDINNRIIDNANNGNLHPSGLFVLAFGNCYFNSYSVNAAVGQIPEASVSYIADNIMAYASGSGVNIPAIDTKSGNLIPDRYFTIPHAKTYATPSVVRPSDITLSITTGSTMIYPNNVYFGAQTSGAPIQSFNFTINLNREPLRAIGYKYPVDRRINFPILVDLNVSTIIDNNVSGNLIQTIKDNIDYDVTINMYNPRCDNTAVNDIAIQYKIKNTKFKGVSYNYNLNNKLIGDFAFEAEIDIDDPRKALFISGSYNIAQPNFPFNYLLLEDNKTGFLYTEDGIPLIIANNPETV